MSDEIKKRLDATEAALDRISDDHPHPCDIGDTVRTVRNAVREVRQKLFGGSGPAQVATEQYRDNWETLFGKKQVVGQA